MAVKKGEIGIDLGTGVQAKVEAGMLIVKGPKGEVKRNVSHPRLDVEVTEGKVKVSSEGKSLSEKRLCCTYRAHVRNMVKGVKEGHEYLIKICSSHFPMNVSISNGQLVVKNFLGDILEGKINALILCFFLYSRKQSHFKFKSQNVNFCNAFLNCFL